VILPCFDEGAEVGDFFMFDFVRFVGRCVDDFLTNESTVSDVSRGWFPVAHAGGKRPVLGLRLFSSQ